MNDFREYSAAFHAQNDDILHFGILGMKWGVRRYQNPDGTLTEAGRKRYDKLMKKADENARWNTIPNDKIAYNLQKKAEKYGTPNNDRYIKKRNSFESDEEKDKWEREQITKFLDEKNSEFHAKNVFDTKGTNLFTEHDDIKNPKRAKEAADLGLKALNKIGRDGYDPSQGITDVDRVWFIWEDQTIGLATIADLALQGKSKSDIKELIDAASKLYTSDDVVYRRKHGIFQLAMTYADDEYLDALFAILNAEGKLKHSAIKKCKRKISK